MPLRRALTRIQMLPETVAWERARREAGELVQYELSLKDTHVQNGRCHWKVAVRSDGKLWRRFHVSPDGRSVILPAEER